MDNNHLNDVEKYFGQPKPEVTEPALQLRADVVTDLANKIVKKLDVENRRRKKKTLNMTEIAAAFIAAATHIDTHRGGVVMPVIREMITQGELQVTGWREGVPQTEFTETGLSWVCLFEGGGIAMAPPSTWEQYKIIGHIDPQELYPAGFVKEHAT